MQPLIANENGVHIFLQGQLHNVHAFCDVCIFVLEKKIVLTCAVNEIIKSSGSSASWSSKYSLFVISC